MVEKVIIQKRVFPINTIPLKEMADKYRDTLEKMLYDLSTKCLGGEEVNMVFPSGNVIIKLK